MAYTDKTLTCSDCGAPFTFTAGEQEFHASKGFTNEPRRCPNCRRARRGAEGGTPGAGRPQRELFSVTCASCGCRLEGIGPEGNEAWFHYRSLGGRDARGDRVDCVDAAHDATGRPALVLA